MAERQDHASTAQAALVCDREGGGVEAALSRLIASALAVFRAESGGVDGLTVDGGLVAVSRSSGAPSDPPPAAERVLVGTHNGDLEVASVDEVALPAVWDGLPRGVLWVTGAPSTVEVDREVAQALATRAGALLEHRRVLGELEHAVVSGVAAEERMLGRIGLDIHDGPTQQMSVALLEVQLLQAELEDARSAGIALPESVAPGLERIYETLGGALHELRELIGTLRPAQFQSRSLEHIVREAVAGFEVRTGIEVSVDAAGDTDVDGISLTQRITFFRILQEALTNAHRHGRASRAWVRLVAEQDLTTLEVADDGCGFDPTTLPEGPEGLPVQIGLAGMRDRARLVGGRCTIDSIPSSGTTVRVSIPHWHAVGTTA